MPQNIIRPCHPSHCGRGFTLLEMLVALLLISMVGGALYSLINQQFIQFRRLQSIQTELTDSQWLASWNQTFFQQDEPKGEETIGGYQVRWISTPLTPHQILDPASVQATQGYQVRLYAIDATLYQNDKVLASKRFIQVASLPLLNGVPVQYHTQSSVNTTKP